ncbi:barrier-to-autointegration factor A-like protein [Aphelenchoides avenae]|nr:barrier-to-autointegration factor A-like protein [Aphelenchus avenae]
MRHKKRPIKRDLRDDAFTSELHQHVAKRTRNEAPAFRQGKVHIEGSSDEEPKSLVGEPLGEKQLTDVDGIDEFIAKRLAAKGWDLQSLLGQLLVMKMKRKDFVAELMQTVAISPADSEKCFACLREYAVKQIVGE